MGFTDMTRQELFDWVKAVYDTTPEYRGGYI